MKVDHSELRQILAEHRLWLDSSKREGRRAVLRGKDLSGFIADQTYLLDEADLNGADLSNSIWDNSSFREADLEGARLIGAKLIGATLQDAKMANAILTKADLTGCKARGVILEKCDLYRADLTSANLKEANLEGANLSRAILPKACLAKANLSQCILTKANLRGCCLIGALMPGANLRDADLRDIGTIGILSTIFPFYKIPFKLDENNIRDCKFSAGVGDPWSVLRRSYTGPRFAFNLLFLVAFALPYIAQALFWVGVNRVEAFVLRPILSSISQASYVLSSSADPVVKAWSFKAEQLLNSLEPISQNVPALQESLDRLSGSLTSLQTLLDEAIQMAKVSTALRAKKWGEQAAELLQRYPSLGQRFQQWSVWELLIGRNKGRVYVFVVLILVGYNLGRGVLTYMVGLLREEEDRNHESPEAVKYALLFRLHQFLSLVYVLSLISFVIGISKWMTIRVVLPL
jgi:hypothetical protein